jgi:TRAP-type mannitol/chloroaromatic compound transport system substrate-binding protein
MGFQNVVKNYYVPDFRQPASFQEILVGKKVWDALPPDLQAIVKWACYAEIIRMTTTSIDLDSKAAEELQRKHGVTFRRTPDDVLRSQLEAMDKVYDAEAKKNPFFAKVLASQREFARRAVPHSQRIRPPLELVVQHYWHKP